MAKKINLNDYLGHSMDCTCGKEHKTNLKIVDIDKDAVSRLPKHIEALGYKKPFLVADVNTWAAAGALVAEKLDVADISYKKYIFNEKELIPDEKTLGSLMMAFSRDCDVMLALDELPACGGGPFAQIYCRTDLQQRVAHVGVEDRPDAEIADRGIGLGREEDLPVNARHAPVVGVFEIASVGPFEYLDGQSVLSRL